MLCSWLPYFFIFTYLCIIIRWFIILHSLSYFWNTFSASINITWNVMWMWTRTHFWFNMFHWLYMFLTCWSFNILIFWFWNISSSWSLFFINILFYTFCMNMNSLILYLKIISILLITWNWCSTTNIKVISSK